MKYKCEEIGFEHLWKEFSPPYPKEPDQYDFPPMGRKCINCGKEQIVKTIYNQDRPIKLWENENEQSS